MTNPPPRPALKRAADAEVHPARPGLAQLRSIPARTEPEVRTERPGPRPASTSDSLLTTPKDKPGKQIGKPKPTKPDSKQDKKDKHGKSSKAAKGRAADKPAKVRLASDLADALAQKAAETGYEPDEVVALLIKAWLET